MKAANTLERVFVEGQVTAIFKQARHDAKLVDSFLREFGKTHAVLAACIVQSDVLVVELAAVLRLGLWEAGGISCHRDAGLPSAADGLKSLVNRALSSGSDAEKPLSRDALLLSLSRIAWNDSSSRIVNVDIGESAEDVLIEVMARFLWENRHTLTQDSPVNQ